MIQTARGRAGETLFEGKMALYANSLVSDSGLKAMFIFKNRALTSHNLDFLKKVGVIKYHAT